MVNRFDASEFSVQKSAFEVKGYQPDTIFLLNIITNLIDL